MYILTTTIITIYIVYIYSVYSLLTVMVNSLSDIRKAIKGMIVMSSDLDAMYTSFLNNQLPGIWERASFASLKSLGSWVADLVFRVKFMRTWLVSGQPHAFPLPVFFFPQVSVYWGVLYTPMLFWWYFLYIHTPYTYIMCIYIHKSYTYIHTIFYMHTYTLLIYV